MLQHWYVLVNLLHQWSHEWFGVCTVEETELNYHQWDIRLVNLQNAWTGGFWPAVGHRQWRLCFPRLLRTVRPCTLVCCPHSRLPIHHCLLTSHLSSNLLILINSALVFPCWCFLLRWIGTMILYTYHKSNFDCNGRGVLHSYLVGLLVVLALIILSLCAIVYVSAQGKSVVISQVSCL